MAGIDRIIQKIQEEADQEIKRQEAMAEGKIEEIQKECREACERILLEAKDRARQEGDLFLSRKHSRALMEEKNRTLAYKQTLISQTLEKALEQVCALEDEAYFRLILFMVSKFARPEDGVVCFSPKDYARLPEHFQEALDRQTKDLGGSLKIGTQTRPIRGGFVLIYGGIEENCSFSAIFQAEDESLRDLLNHCLFDPEDKPPGDRDAENNDSEDGRPADKEAKEAAYEK